VTAKRVLSGNGITPTASSTGLQVFIGRSLGMADDHDSAYQEMFKLGYVRVDERDTIVFLENPKIASVGDLSREQAEFAKSKGLEGKEISFNDTQFVQTRQSGANANEMVSRLVD
jgi:hypothetical protein